MRSRQHADRATIGSTPRIFRSVATGISVVLGLGSCGSAGVTNDRHSMVTNSDGASTLASESLAGDGGDYTHGILTIENATDQPITLQGVRLVDPVGNIELVDAYVVPPKRPVLYVSSADTFPPDGVGPLLRPLTGYELQPFPEGEGKNRNVEVVLHLEIAKGELVAGYPSFCVQFSRSGSDQLRERCVDHAFFACPDPAADDCGPSRE